MVLKASLVLVFLLVLVSLAQHANANQQHVGREKTCPANAEECTRDVDTNLREGVSLLQHQGSIAKGIVEEDAEDRLDAPAELSQTAELPEETPEELLGDRNTNETALDESVLQEAGQDESVRASRRRTSRRRSSRRRTRRSSRRRGRKFASGGSAHRRRSRSRTSARRTPPHAHRRRAKKAGGPAHRRESDMAAAQGAYAAACKGKKIGSSCSAFNGVYTGKCMKATQGDNIGQVECQRPENEEPIIKACLGKGPGQPCIIKKEGTEMKGHCVSNRSPVKKTSYCQPAGFR